MDIQDTRMPLTSQNVTAERIEALRELFPEAFTEGAIDFAKLKQALGDFTDDSPERYGLSWAGKSDAIRAVQSLSSGTLVPCKEESVNFDTTENLFIEGDNLEALKLLQKSYYGKVKMIYIDPPYNTGHEFIYPDNYCEGLEDYLKYSGQVDASGTQLVSDTEKSGRHHSKWLSMMYPRLFLANNLLSDDGVVFVSIDDNEVHNLRFIMNEIFGEENFLGCILWQKKYAPSNDTVDFSDAHDFILVYGKMRKFSEAGKAFALLGRMERTEEQNKLYKNPDNDPRGLWASDNYLCNKTADQRPNLYYPIIHPKTGKEIWPSRTAVWRYSKARHGHNVRENRVWWGINGENEVPRYKRFLDEVGGVIADTWWTHRDAGHNDEAKKQIKALFPDAPQVFDTPKPTRLINRMLKLATNPDDDCIVLDFFAGSGTTAHAVLKLNQEDGGNRKFVLIQLPEPTGNDDFPTIADLCKERVRRVIKKLNDEDGTKLDLDNGEQDRGFKVFKLTSSNFKLWNADETPKDAEALAAQLKLYADHVILGRSQDDILYELLLKAGFSLTAKVEQKEAAGQKIYSVADGMLLVCLEDEITQETLREMMGLKPEMVLCLDNAFKGNDQLKTNTVLEMKSHDIKFHTV